MNQMSRLIAFLALAIGLIAIFIMHNGDVVNGGNSPNTVVFSSLLMLAFATLLLEHWFTKPTDTIASAIAVLLTILPSRESLSEMGGILSILAGYCVSILALASVSILLSSQETDPRSLRTKTADYFRKISTTLGSSRLLFALLFFTCLVAYGRSGSFEFVQLMAFAGLVLVIDPKRLPSLLWRQTHTQPIGEVIGVQSRNTILAKLATNREAVSRYDFVEFCDAGDNNRRRKGIIIDNWVLNLEQWIKIFSGSLSHP